MLENLPENNLLIDHYLQELRTLSSEIVRTFNEIESIVHSRKQGTEAVFTFPHIPDKYFFIQPDVFTRIASIQVHSANINKILFATPRKKNEANSKYDYRVKRSDELQKYFDMDRISEIRSNDVRNILEHFDERLDNISLWLWNRSIDGEYEVIASNIILSGEGALHGKPYYLKCYIIDSKIYKNAEKESNLGELVSEANYIRTVVESKLISNPQAGSIIIIPPRPKS